MQIVYWEPGNGSGYRVGVATVDGQPENIVFCFGLGDHPMAAYITSRREPHAFAYFVEKWNSIRMDGNLIDLWAGFTALRHVLGYATIWEELPEQTRRSATQMFAEGEFLSTPQRELERYSSNWQEQLRPLVQALAR